MWSQLSKKILVTGPQLGVTVTDCLSPAINCTGGMADPIGGSTHPRPLASSAGVLQMTEVLLYIHPSMRFSEGMKVIGSGSALGIWGSRKHGIRVIQDFGAAKADSLPLSSEHHRSTVIGSGGRDDGSSRTVSGYWLGEILPLWDDWQYLEIFFIVKIGMGEYYCHLLVRGHVHF